MATTQNVAFPTDPRFIDMTGMTCSSWIVLRYAGRGNNTKAVWECQCKCGAIKNVEGSQLRSGGSQSCGCVRKNKNNGLRYGRLVIVGHVGTYYNGKQAKYLCRCDCGNMKELWKTSLKAGVDSCGCLTKEKLIRRSTKHGQSNTKVYKVWAGMRDRCENANNAAYKDYGGRGIGVCERWQRFEAFTADMGPRPPGMTIERLNNDGNYEPANCVWASRHAQQNNRRVNRRIQGRTISEIARDLGMTQSGIHSRIRLGWPDELIITTPALPTGKKLLCKPR